ncbi:type-F conjugative transfer system secretin TraK [Pseudomonas sp. Irchel 3E13]|uniref:TraK domain-containing protein n=1 Tax=Pseudomonas sp. Irchel 3E13 TaxID=2008975 RepID=UPI000BA4CF60|nr:type-F conjugative transfer system secretin TraK [Pseudomonas sp. Irchel 3E13]
MKCKQVKLALIITAFAAVQSVHARELKIPQMPSASKETMVVEASPRSVNPADYGMEDGEAAARAALAEAPAQNPPVHPAPAAAAPAPAPVKPSSPAAKKDGDLMQVSGGGRGGDLQEVPASVAKTSAGGGESPATVSSLEDVVVQPGVNTIVPVAVGHLNRIVTPFEKPIVQTVSQSVFEVKGNVVYISTQDPSPIAMYITPSNDESVAISLTLAPRKIPPIQANLIIGQLPSAGGSGVPAGQGGFRYSGQAKKWEEGQPYMESIKGIMRALALGGIPKGYSMGKLNRTDTIPACFQDGISFDFSRAQIVMGHNFKAVIGVARNASSVPVMFDETSCTHPQLAAAAAWPRNMLEPGQATEIYIVTRVGDAPAEDSSRPSLLN